MKIGVQLGPVSISSDGGSRACTWYGKGTVTTPDGRVVDFRCGHQHRSQAMAIECSQRRRKQVERGQGDYLITRVRSTPQSRERDRQREAQRKARAAARAERKQARARDQALARAETFRRWAEWKQAQRQEPVARPPEAAARPQKEPDRPPAVPRARPRHSSAKRRPLGWPGWGLLCSGAAFVIAVTLVAVAGNNPRSGAATAGAALLVLALPAALVCISGAGWRAVRRRRAAR
jgi:hypothetical protein